MTITEFLTARINEDERHALEAGAVRYEVELLKKHQSGVHAEHVARHSPDRVIVDCDARRAMVQICADVVEHDTEGDVAGLASQMLDFLAAPYAGHPDWREEWRAAI